MAKRISTYRYCIHTFCGLLLLAFGNVVFAQQESPAIIKLKKKLQVEKTDTGIAHTYSRLVVEYSKTSFDSMKHYAVVSVKRAEKVNNKEALMRAYSALGIAYTVMGIKPDSSLYCFNNSLALAREVGNEDFVSSSLIRLSYVYINLDFFEKALKINLDLLKVVESKKDSVTLCRTYDAISIILCQMHRFDEAVAYSEKAVAMGKKVASEENLMTYYINLSVAYQGWKKNDEAEKYLLLAKELSIKRGDKYSYANIVLNESMLFIDKKQFDVAIKLLLPLTTPEMEALQDPYSNCKLYLILGGAYHDLNKLDSAEYAFNIAKKYADAVNDWEGLENVYFNLAGLKSERNNYKEAYDYLYNAYTLRDSVFNQEKNRSITNMKIGYEADKKENENKQLIEEANLKDTQIRQQFIIIIILVLLLLVIVFGGIYLYRQRRIIAGQREKLLEQKLLQMQLNPHFIFNSLQAIQDYIYGNNEKEASRYLSKFARLMRLTLENSRQENILLKTEIESLENYLALQKLRMGDRLNYEIIVDENLDPSFTEIPPMMVQPFVENAVEHGIKMKDAPGYVKVEFGLQGYMLNINVSDDGPGISAEGKANGHQSLSMQIIKERLELFGRKKKYKPQLNITDLGTTQNKGTRVEINLPTEG